MVTVTKKWYQHGRLHRVDGPATEINGVKKWYRDNCLHREDGPAVEHINGDKCWYQYGKLHCSDGPEIVSEDGRWTWCQHGKIHRLDGPAVYDPARGYKWYFEGFEVSPEILAKIAARIKRRKDRLHILILDCLMPKIYDPSRKSGQRRMLDSYMECIRTGTTEL